MWVRVAVTFLLLLLPTALHAQAEKRVALVIGNSAYQNTPSLPNPVNDAADMSAVLKKQGFKTIEGFDLDRMWGFGGERPWSDVSTALEPLLDRPDGGGGELSPTECAALLPRLEAIVDQWRNEVGVPRTHIDAAQQLTVVLRLCVAKDVGLLFL